MAAETGAEADAFVGDGLASHGAGHDLEERTLAALDDAFARTRCKSTTAPCRSKDGTVSSITSVATTIGRRPAA